MTNGIIEIGVHRNRKGSFTNAILKNKPQSIPYLGIESVEKKKYRVEKHFVGQMDYGVGIAYKI